MGDLAFFLGSNFCDAAIQLNFMGTACGTHAGVMTAGWVVLIAGIVGLLLGFQVVTKSAHGV